MSDTTLTDFLIESADRFPSRQAVVETDGASVTYAELMVLAQRVQRVLRARGVAPGDRVGVCLPKSIDAVAAMSGTLLCGAVYVPIDPESPPSRTRQIAPDAGITALVISAPLSHRLEADSAFGPLAPIAFVLPQVGGGRGIATLTTGPSTPVTRPPSPRVDADAPAHLLYTSGSTGRPKGILLSHRAAVVFVDWFAAMLHVTEHDRVASHAPFHFAMSILDIFLAQRNGATLVLIDEAASRDPLRIVPLIERERISIWFSTPAILSALEEYGHLERHNGSSLRFVLFAGEAYPVPRLRMLMEKWPSPRYFNLFGATETNVRFWYEVPSPLPLDAPPYLPIGRPLDHFRTLVVEDDRPVGTGEAGELLLSGPGILTDYWNNPALSASAFLVDADGTRWFRTGDIVTEQPDGTFLFRGRQDRMVKRRGYRIELAEIEVALSQHTALASVAVVSYPNENAGARIVAFFTAHGDDVPSIIDLKQFCSAKLPTYMIPDRFVRFEQLPITSTGKTDYQSLTDDAAANE